MNEYVFEAPFGNFEILDLATPAGIARLEEIILPEPLHQHSPAAHSVFDTILSSGSCRSAVVESGYTDREHARAYQKFYARAFPEYGRYSIRLHFFSLLVTRRDLSNLERPKFGKAYLGYCVIRPLRVRKIGRTVLKPILVDPAGDFPLTLSEFYVNLAGSRLSVQGAPFLEQDGRVAMCATCAIWSSTMAAAQKFDLPRATAAEITELALQFPLGERVLGSVGLNAEEMETALRRMGYNPLSLGIKDRESALQAIHPYLEAGLAPILLLQLPDGGHAVVVVGHGYNTRLRPGRKAKVVWEGRPISFWRSSQWINYLLVHDDQRGPYRKMRFLRASRSSEGCPVEIDMTFSSFTDNAGWPSKTKAVLYGAIVPVPPGISMTGIEAEEKAARLMQILFHMLGLGTPGNVVLRTYLARSNDFKRHVANQGLPAVVRNLYRGKPMPRWIWVTEICTVRDVTIIGQGSRQIRGEIVLDGNGSPATPDFVAAHLVLGKLGFVSLMKPEDGNAVDALARGIVYRNARPYRALVR